MADFHLVDYSTLTSDQKSEYYRWLIGNAKRLQELYDEKFIKFEEVREVTDEKTHRIQDNLEYYRTLKIRVLNKKAERRAMTVIVSKMRDATKIIEADMKNLEQQRDRVSKSYKGWDEIGKQMQKKLKKRQESALNEFKSKTETTKEAKIAKHKEVFDQLQERKQSFETTNEILDKKCQDLADVYAEIQELDNECSKMDYNELLTYKNNLINELNDKIKIREEKLSVIDVKKNELDEIIGKSMELLNVSDEIKINVEEAAERNRLKFKEVECTTMIAHKAMSKKFEAMIKDLEHKVKNGFDRLKDLVAKRDTHNTMIPDLKETLSAQQQEIKNVELEKGEVQQRINKAKDSIDTNKTKRNKFDEYEMEKIQAAKAKIHQLEMELKELQNKYREKFIENEASQEFLVELEKLFDTQAASSEYDSSAIEDSKSTSSSDNKPVIQFKDISEFDINHVINMLDPVTSCESIHKPKP